MKYQDYYKILGVERDADAAEIKKAYRKMARKYHPDVNSSHDSEEKFKEVNEAYDVLKDAEKRKSYNQFGKNWKHGQEFNSGGWGGASAGGGGVGGGDFSDLFESMFSRGGGAGGFSGGGAGFGSGAGRQRPSKGQDQSLKLDITLEEAFNGGEKSIQLSRSEQSAGGLATPTLKKLKVNIPKGVTSGKKIRLSRQGHASASGGEAGDLLLEMNILPHRWFRLDGRDIVLKCPVTPWEAALGSKVTVPTLSGQIELKIAPGMQSGQRMRLKGRGLPATAASEVAGDMFVEIQIYIPPAEDDEMKQWYQSMQQKFAFNPRTF